MDLLLKYLLFLTPKMVLLACFLIINASASETTSFCKSVYLMCNSSATLSEFNFPTQPHLSKKKNFFKKSDIFVGGQMTRPNLRNKDGLDTLLPADFTEHLSTKPETLHALSEILSSSSASSFAEYVRGSVCSSGKQVDDRVELKICPTSVVGMVELATKEEGSHHLDILHSNTGLAEHAEEEMLVTNVALRRSARMDTSIVCRQMSLASWAVSMCYAMKGVENIQATMRPRDGEEIIVGIQCHKDNGEEGWCDWVMPDTLVGVVKREDEEEIDEEEDEEEGTEWMKGMKFSFQDVKNTVEEKASNVKASLNLKLESMKEKSTEVKQTVEDKAAIAKDEVVEKASNVGTSVKTNMDKVETKVKEAAASPLGSQVVEAAANQAVAFVEGIPTNGFKGSLANVAANVAGEGVKVAVNALPLP